MSRRGRPRRRRSATPSWGAGDRGCRRGGFRNFDGPAPVRSARSVCGGDGRTTVTLRHATDSIAGAGRGHERRKNTGSSVSASSTERASAACSTSSGTQSGKASTCTRCAPDAVCSSWIAARFGRSSDPPAQHAAPPLLPSPKSPSPMRWGRSVAVGKEPSVDDLDSPPKICRSMPSAARVVNQRRKPWRTMAGRGTEIAVRQS